MRDPIVEAATTMRHGAMLSTATAPSRDGGGVHDHRPPHDRPRTAVPAHTSPRATWEAIVVLGGAGSPWPASCPRSARLPCPAAPSAAQSGYPAAPRSRPPLASAMTRASSSHSSSAPKGFDIEFVYAKY